jgi:class 3 adenylate cyclase/predicted ATPase
MRDARPPDRGNRRQLTVLFCDVAGSSQLLESLNDENWSYALREYHASCQAIIANHDGHVAQYLGDGLLAYFGYPVAHEDNPHRAIRAALQILSQIDAMNARIQAAIAPCEASLRLRIAIHTGVVVVDEIGKHASADHIALGIVPTIAARLQQEARENTLVISEATHRLVSGAFECHSLGAFALKGLSSPQPAYEVTGESGLTSRFDIGIAKGLTPYVGRERELDLLQSVWREAVTASGRVLLIDGDPGIGKSRLVHEFSRSLDASEHRMLVCRCSAYNRNSAYFPIIQLLHSLLGLQQGDPPLLKLDRIEQALLRAGRELSEAVPLIARLLSISCQGRYPEPQATPLQDKQRLHDLLVEWLRHDSTFKPIVMFVEDLHWVDPSSRELFERLSVAIADRRILLLLAFRSEFQLEWQHLAHVRRLSLGPLTRRAAESMVRHLQGGRALHADVVNRLISSTDGVPLFLEESTLMALAHGDNTTIPATLHDLLTARLDQLGPAKELAQTAATIGAEFSYEMLRAVSKLDATTLQSQVDQLVAAGLVRRDENASPPAYSFKHALVRDTAYQSLLSRARRASHERIADVFSDQFPDIARNQPELIAHHCTEAGLTQRAVDLWQKAGLRSAERYELPEATRHLRKGLEVLAALPASAARQRQELELQSVLAGRLIATEGYGAADVERVYTRALELATELGDAPRRLQMMLGLESFHFMRSNFQTAHRLADACLVLARQLGDPARELVIHWVLGEIFFHQGDHALCETHLGECMSHYRRNFHRPRTLQDPAVMSWSYCSWTHWKTGYPDRALKTIGQAISLAEELAHPFSMSVAYSFAAGLYLFRGELEQAGRHADRAIELCTEHGFPVWLAFCTVVRGSVLSRQGVTAGLEQMEHGIKLWQSSGAVVTTPYYLVLLAEGLSAAGRPHDALDRLEEAQSLVDRTGERYYEAEISRVRGEILLEARGLRAALNDAEACFLRAIDISQRQGVRSLELRAVMSLTRLQMRSDPGVDVRSRLGAIYHWFTEGMDTADLVNARQLLAELVW